MKRLMRMLNFTKPSEMLEFAVHYMGAICRKSVDHSITDASIRRQAEAKIERKRKKSE
ncbi:hypothetical protein [Bradyrhizobium sp.]|uniref:hypothetical protein n=1 Tax=Bradyrhizobium sp. TaxID=376 RepID=UPI0027351FEF|nr:hypothetical protein [Bradyrhizobium sp.]